MLLGISNARQIAESCARHKILWMWGFILVISIALFVGFYVTRNRPVTQFKIPAWLVAVPILFVVLYMIRSYGSVVQQMSSDTIEYQLSGMSKKDYLNYKIGDDRTNTTFAASATSATVLAGSNLLGPFIRADNR